MKKILLLFAVFAMVACKNGGGDAVDQTKPEEVVNALFKAAQTSNFDMLKNLCDPKNENDGDTRELCNLTEERKKEFVEYFKDGKVTGSAVIEGDEASVPFVFGPNGSESEEMKLIKRDGKWYFYSF